MEDITEEAEHLKNPVARILLANYEVIGKLSRRERDTPRGIISNNV